MYEYIKSKSLDCKTNAEAWSNYSKWNELIATYFFSEKFEDRPVYLDISDQLLATFSEKLDLSVADTVNDFKNSIIDTLNRASPFNLHLDNAFKWKRRAEEETPPFVALLALFSYVAEKMVRDNDFGANNYYGRLQRELRLADDDHAELQKSYREISEFCWPWLNEWIASYDGEIGLPTAKALDSRVYVSVAISQALVREQDRNALKRIFMESGLNPGQRLGKMEMLSLLLHWSSSSGGSSSLSKMIQRGGDIRDKVSEIACSELEAWDGKLSLKESLENAARLFYIATFKSYPQNKITLYLCTNSAREIESSYALTDDSSDEARIGFKGYQNEITLDYLDDFGVSVLEPFEKISHGDALLSKLRIKNQKSNRLLERNGQPICILMYRLEIGAYQEVSRAVIGAPSIVLAHQSILERVTDALNDIARPGFKLLNATQARGLPEGWVLITDVQILKTKEIRGLESLSPLLGGSVSLVGGLYLGNEAWLKSLPPEIVISLDTNKGVSVELIQMLDFGKKINKVKFNPGSGVQFISLKDYELPDGDYQIIVFEGSPQKKIEVSNFKIRSGSSVRMYKRSNSAKLTYILSSDNPVNSISALKSPKIPEDPILLSGCNIFGRSTLEESYPKLKIQTGSSLLTTPEGIDKHERSALTKTTTLDAGSCVLRGYHVKVYDQVPIGAPVGYLVRAKCSDCSLTVWERTRGYYTGTHRRREQLDPLRPVNPISNINLKAVTPIKDSLYPNRPTYRQIFDALCYIKEGTFERFSSIIRAQNDEPWAPYEALRELVGLGHVDLQLDSNTLKPHAWRITDPSLILTGDSKFTVLGWCSDAFIEQLRDVSASLGGTLEVLETNENFPIFEILGIDSDSIDGFAEIVSAVSAFPVTCTKKFTNKLLAAIPCLSELARSLPQVEMPEKNLQYFDPDDMKWKAVDSEIRRGSYRHDLNGVKYFFLPNDFIKSSNAYLTDARLTKYLSLAEKYWKFFKYDEKLGILQTPIGMELPFLYERVAVSCSGRVPEKANGLTTYTQINKDIAEGLAFKLFNHPI